MSVRSQRLSDEIQKSLARLLQVELKDPRVGFVTVSGVDVSRDLSFADVYVTWMHANSAEDCEKELAALQNTAGFLRSKLAKMLMTRIVPKLRFKFDESFAAGQKMDMLLSQLKPKQDKSLDDVEQSELFDEQSELTAERSKIDGENSDQQNDSDADQKPSSRFSEK